MGKILASQGKNGEAITHFQKALQINPGFAEAHYNMGIVLTSQGNIDEAIKF